MRTYATAMKLLRQFNRCFWITESRISICTMQSEDASPVSSTGSRRRRYSELLTARGGDIGKWNERMSIGGLVGGHLEGEHTLGCLGPPSEIVGKAPECHLKCQSRFTDGLATRA